MPTRILPTKIVFRCPKCEACFQATQFKSSDGVSDRFKCPKCLTVVHRWTGRYTYLDWGRFPVGDGS
jgi:uncharacterized C2H2 Zn-finger protein